MKKQKHYLIVVELSRQCCFCFLCFFPFVVVYTPVVRLQSLTLDLTRCAKKRA